MTADLYPRPPGCTCDLGPVPTDGTDEQAADYLTRNADCPHTDPGAAEEMRRIAGRYAERRAA